MDFRALSKPEDSIGLLSIGRKSTVHTADDNGFK
jgi:hypothetical protein